MPLRPLLLLLVALCGGCTKGERPAPPSSAGTTFTKRAPSVGDKHEKTSELTLRASLETEVAGKSAETELVTHERSRRTEEVLAVADGSVTKTRVTLEVEDGAGPVTSRTYDVEGGGVDPVTAALPVAPLAPGQKVDALERAIADQMKGLEVANVEVTFEGAKGDDGAFAIAIKVGKMEGPVAMTMDLKGKLYVSTKTGWPASMHLEGPVTATSADPTMKVRGAGTVTMHVEDR